MIRAYLILFLSLSLSWTSLSQTSDLYKKYNDELESARNLKDFEKLASSYFKLALYEEDKKRNFERSFEYFSRALEFYEFNQDTTGIRETEFHIARQLLKNDMVPEALEEFNRLKTYYESTNNRKKVTEIELQLFKLYFGELDIDNAKKSLDFIETQLSNIKDSPLHTEYIISQIQYNKLLQQFDVALDLSNECYQRSMDSDNKEDMANCLAERGEIFLRFGEYDQSIDDFLKSLNFLSQIPYSKERLLIYKNLVDCYQNIEDLENSLLYSNRYAILQDSILNENRIIAVSNVTYKYESREKTAEIKALEREKAMTELSNQQQKRALIVLGLVLGLLTIGIYYIVRFYSEKINTAKIIEEQNEKINTQMINELKDKIQINSMKSMIEGQEVERERIAKDLHDSLGGLLSTIKLQVDNIRSNGNGHIDGNEIDQATHLLDTAVGEVRTISQNLQPSALSRLGLIPAINDLVNRYDNKFGPDIDFQHFDIPIKLDTTVSLGIYRIIQEILTNAIKHSNANEILVQLNKEEDEIIIHIEDDGKGFNHTKKQKGMGLENIRSRVNYLKGIIEIDSRKNAGTSFIIHIPIKISMTSE